MLQLGWFGLTNPWLLVASPKYLKKAGVPRQPADLSAHQALIYSSVQGNDVWRVLSPRAEAATVPVTARLRSNNLSTVLQATLPDDPTGGFVVIYAFASPQQAQAAAAEIGRPALEVRLAHGGGDSREIEVLGASQGPGACSERAV